MTAISGVSGIPNLASDRRIGHCVVDEVSADSLHRRTGSWGIGFKPKNSMEFL